MRQTGSVPRMLNVVEIVYSHLSLLFTPLVFSFFLPNFGLHLNKKKYEKLRKIVICKLCTTGSFWFSLLIFLLFDFMKERTPVSLKKKNTEKMGRYSGKTARLSYMLVLTSTYFLVEIIVGYVTNSMALVADSFHMLSDVLALVIGLFSGTTTSFSWSI